MKVAMLVFDIREDWFTGRLNARCLTTGEQEAIDQQRLVHMTRHSVHLVGLPTAGAEDFAAREGKRPHFDFRTVRFINPSMLVFVGEASRFVFLITSPQKTTLSEGPT